MELYFIPPHVFTVWYLVKHRNKCVFKGIGVVQLVDRGSVLGRAAEGAHSACHPVRTGSCFRGVKAASA